MSESTAEHVFRIVTGVLVAALGAAVVLLDASDKSPTTVGTVAGLLLVFAGGLVIAPEKVKAIALTMKDTLKGVPTPPVE